MTIQCKAIGCSETVPVNVDFCQSCLETAEDKPSTTYSSHWDLGTDVFHKPDRGDTFLDVFAVHKHFGILDPSGCIHHASKLLLLSSKHSSERDQFIAVEEARNTLDRWMTLNH